MSHDIVRDAREDREDAAKWRRLAVMSVTRKAFALFFAVLWRKRHLPLGDASDAR